MWLIALYKGDKNNPNKRQGGPQGAAGTQTIYDSRVKTGGVALAAVRIIGVHMY